MRRGERPDSSDGVRAAPTSVFCAICLLALAGCGSGAPDPPAQLLDSRVADPAVEVDGLRHDWEGNLTRVGGTDVFAGFHRSGDALYVAVVSQSPGFDARVFRSGLTVWLDTTATRRRAHGIRFPVFGPESRSRLRADSASGRPDRERLLRAAGTDLVLVTEGGGETRISPAEAEGLEVAASVDRGLFTWELRVPLVPLDGGGAPHALAAAPGDTISVGLQAGGDQGELAGSSAAPPDSAASDSAAAARPEGEEARRPPGGFGGAAGLGSGDVPELEIWVRVSLDGTGAAPTGGP